MSAVRQATLRLSLRASFLEKREKWCTPSISVTVKRTGPRYASPLMWPTRPAPHVENRATRPVAIPDLEDHLLPSLVSSSWDNFSRRVRTSGVTSSIILNFSFALGRSETKGALKR